MIFLLTGSTGAGKTLSAVEWIQRVRAETPDRLVYSNIDGLNIPGVLPLDRDSILSWHESCEKGSILFIDEAQHYWRAQRSGDPSQAVIEMETHRHDGIDIVLMTPHPTFLHANIRKLQPTHIHLVAYTNHSALRWEWLDCHDDVASDATRAVGDFKEWEYPAECYGSYISASSHTKSMKRPWKRIIARVVLIISILAMVAGVLVGGYYAVKKGKESTAAFKTSQGASPSSSGKRAGLFTAGQGGPVVYATAAEYAEAQVPRIEAMPWSAPIYDGQAVTAHPRLFCIAVVDDRCSCVTEQGTKARVSTAVCREIAVNGPPYDPFMPVKQDASVSPASVVAGAPVAPASSNPRSPSTAPVLGVLGPPSLSSRQTASVYVPPTYGEWNADAFGSK